MNSSFKIAIKKGAKLKLGKHFRTRNNVSLRYMRLIKRNMDQIVALCEKHKVLELCVFGSAVNGRFNKNSDVDFNFVERATFDKTYTVLSDR